MATPAQIAANQRNAIRSTGPRTEAGKSRSRANALRDGFFSQKVHLRDEQEREDFAALRGAVVESLRPEDGMQRWVVEQIVLQQWKLRLLQNAPVPDDADDAWFERQEKREQRMVNLVLRLTKELRRLQKGSAARDEQATEDAAPAADALDAAEEWNEANLDRAEGSEPAAEADPADAADAAAIMKVVYGVS